MWVGCGKGCGRRQVAGLRCLETFARGRRSAGPRLWATSLWRSPDRRARLPAGRCSSLPNLSCRPRTSGRVSVVVTRHKYCGDQSPRRCRLTTVTVTRVGRFWGHNGRSREGQEPRSASVARSWDECRPRGHGCDELRRAYNPLRPRDARRAGCPQRNPVPRHPEARSRECARAPAGNGLEKASGSAHSTPMPENRPADARSASTSALARRSPTRQTALQGRLHLLCAIAPKKSSKLGLTQQNTAANRVRSTFRNENRDQCPHAHKKAAI